MRRQATARPARRPAARPQLRRSRQVRRSARRSAASFTSRNVSRQAARGIAWKKSALVCTSFHAMPRASEDPGPAERPPLVTVFLTHLARERDVSTNTVKAYSRDLDEFCAFLGPYSGTERLDWGKVDRLAMRSFLAHLTRRGLGKRSIARTLSAVRTFYAFLHRNDVVEVNPARSVGSPKTEKYLPGYLDRAQVETLFTAAVTRAGEGHYADVRNLAILELFYSAGLRLSELRGINRPDLDLLAGLVKVRGKGRKERIVPVGQHAQGALRNYERVRDE